MAHVGMDRVQAGFDRAQVAWNHSGGVMIVPSYFSIGANAVKKSTDYGVTWATVGSLGSTPYGKIARSPGVLMCGISNFAIGQLWRSVNEGVDFTMVYQSSVGAAMRGICWCGGDTWLAGADWAGSPFTGEIVKSTNRGVSWSQVATHTVKKVVYCGGTTCIAFGALASGGLYYSKIWKSTDLGSTWTEVYSAATTLSGFGYTFFAAAFLGDGVLVAGESTSLSAGYVLRSTDNGATWTRGAAHGRVFSIATCGDGTAVFVKYAAGAYPLMRSADAGITWAQTGSMATCRALGGFDGGIMIAAPHNTGPYWKRSNDSGASWSDISEATFDVWDFVGLT